MTTQVKTKNGTQGKKVFVGLSGGVDSSVSAVLLKKAGYDVTGVFIKVWQPDWISCTWKEDRLDAMRVCAALEIPFITIDLEKEYKREVVDYMIAEYKAGRTPNPDVMCNKYVKFGAFFNWAMNNGADYVATGHYAQVKVEGEEKSKTSVLRAKLFAGLDANKDQSYFLWTLTQKQLTHTLFPVGHLEKPEVRKIAEKGGLVTATKKDSQGLCFIGKIDMKDFLKEYIRPEAGKVLNEKGEIIGEHDGAVFFTIGERHGFIITKKGTNDLPYYVVSKDNEKNTIAVSNKTNDGLLSTTTNSAHIKNVNWIDTIPAIGDKIMARGRYRQALVACKVTALHGETATLSFDEPQSTLTPGQSLVMYQNGECLGGGIIQ